MPFKSITWLITVWLVLCGVKTVYGHEFWIAPEKYSLPQNSKIIARLQVGRNMRGTELPFAADSFQSFTVRDRDGTYDIKGNLGDMPALSYEAASPGLRVISYHSSPNKAQFDDWQKFVNYLKYEGLSDIAGLHKERGLPDRGFSEQYTRFAKSLVQIGPVEKVDNDRATGAPLELVAESNPYTPGLKSLKVRLLRHGQPVAGRQIAVFRYDGEVSRFLVETDAVGRVSVPIVTGGVFLLNATDIQPAQQRETPWKSYWASLTFGLPVGLPQLHPLDPLHRLEISRTVRVIGKSGYASRDTRIALITLAEPDKADMLAWKAGAPSNRQAFAIVRNGSEVFEAVVDLRSGNLKKWTHIPGVQPAVSSAEWVLAEKLTKQHPEWITAMRKRGYSDFSNVFCEPLSAGYFAVPEDAGKRLLRMPCYDIEGATTNIYGRPIEGLISVVDLNAGAVVRIVDESVLQVSDASHNFDVVLPALATDQKAPNLATRPDDWTVATNGREITWRRWSFHLGFDHRFGPVLSLVRHRDAQRQRMILYQGHVSEVFVPYMDKSQSWYFRSYMDVGEYGLGRLSSPLSSGLDCPAGAIYFDATLANPNGSTQKRKQVVCVFERDTSAPLWRHWEALNKSYAGRPARELIVRSIPTIGNYDYIIDWVFTLKGEIRVDIGATGIDAVKGVDAKTMNEPEAKHATESGMLVAPNLVAVHHDHYFSVRLDIDVDGPINTFVREKLSSVSIPEPSHRKSLWRLQQMAMHSEGALTARQGPELWRIESAVGKTALGHRPSYQISGGSSATSLLSPEDWPQRRAAFSSESLWITTRKPGELFAAGQYPNQNPGGQGLPEYINGESIVASDIVAWYTIGFHHLTRPEDWPVLPTVWHRLRLRPYGFFKRNPNLANQ